MSSNNAAEGGGWFGSISSMYDYASSSISSMLGYEDLDVVDPTSSTAAKGLPQDDGGRNQEERKQIWGTKQFQQYIGMDVTSLLSVPVWIMEPFTILQKMAEMMEYTELLDQADTCEDEFERMALVVAFTITPFGSSERAWKPFNPILGETFELQTGKGVTYMAEQVSHHPPVGASHAENKHFSYDLVSAPATKFLGNSLEVYPHGRTRIQLKSTGEVFTLLPPNAKVNNIVIGRTWVDNCGQLVLINSTTGSRCELEFTPCGWFGYGRYEYSGHISDKDGVKRLKVSGKWNSHVEVVRCDEDGEPLEDDEPHRLWTCSEKPEGDYYGFTHFAHELNSCEGQATPLPSDSRRRPDRYLLETGESTAANSAKYELEEMQRAERKEREAKGDSWTPRWFRLVEKPKLLAEEPDTEKVPFWEFTGEYMQRAAAAPAKADEVLGKGFCPWQYPDLHTKKE